MSLLLSVFFVAMGTVSFVLAVNNIVQEGLNSALTQIKNNENQEICGWILSENVTKKRIIQIKKKFGSSDSESALAGKGSTIDLSNSHNNKENRFEKKD